MGVIPDEGLIKNPRLLIVSKYTIVIANLYRNSTVITEMVLIFCYKWVFDHNQQFGPLAIYKLGARLYCFTYMYKSILLGYLSLPLYTYNDTFVTKSWSFISQLQLGWQIMLQISLRNLQTSYGKYFNVCSCYCETNFNSLYNSVFMSWRVSPSLPQLTWLLISCHCSHLEWMMIWLPASNYYHVQDILTLNIIVPCLVSELVTRNSLLPWCMYIQPSAWISNSELSLKS